jgi:hypothetical protein
MATDVRHRGSAANTARLKYEFARRGWNTVVAARKTKCARWTISRALNGHPIAHSSLQKIAEALAAAPIVDGGLLAKPTQLEEG